MNERHINRLDELAQDIPPPRDLWPAISAAISEEARAEAAQSGAAPARVTRPAVWQRPAYAMAAALALVAVGVWMGVKIATPPSGATIAQTSTQPSTDPSVVPASVLRDSAYRQQRNELLKQVQVKLNGMPQADREKIAKSLEALRRSISEIETELGHDPANALLQELLVSSCQEEMRVLTTVRDSGSQEI